MADSEDKKKAVAPAGATARTQKSSASGGAADAGARNSDAGIDKAFLRAENEDDDGYDPYSDRRPASEPLFERDPWN